MGAARLFRPIPDSAVPAPASIRVSVATIANRTVVELEPADGLHRVIRRGMTGVTGGQMAPRGSRIGFTPE